MDGRYAFGVYRHVEVARIGCDLDVANPPSAVVRQRLEFVSGSRTMRVFRGSETLLRAGMSMRKILPPTR